MEKNVKFANSLLLKKRKNNFRDRKKTRQCHHQKCKEEIYVMKNVSDLMLLLSKAKPQIFSNFIYIFDWCQNFCGKFLSGVSLLFGIGLPIESPRSCRTHRAKDMFSVWTHLPHLEITQLASSQNSGIIQDNFERDGSLRQN